MYAWLTPPPEGTGTPVFYQQAVLLLLPLELAPVPASAPAAGSAGPGCTGGTAVVGGGPGATCTPRGGPLGHQAAAGPVAGAAGRAAAAGPSGEAGSAAGVSSADTGPASGDGAPAATAMGPSRRYTLRGGWGLVQHLAQAGLCDVPADGQPGAHPPHPDLLPMCGAYLLLVRTPAPAPAPSQGQPQRARGATAPISQVEGEARAETPAGQPGPSQQRPLALLRPQQALEMLGHPSATAAAAAAGGSAAAVPWRWESMVRVLMEEVGAIPYVSWRCAVACPLRPAKSTARGQLR